MSKWTPRSEIRKLVQFIHFTVHFTLSRQFGLNIYINYCHTPLPLPLFIILSFTRFMSCIYTMEYKRVVRHWGVVNQLLLIVPELSILANSTLI